MSVVLNGKGQRIAERTQRTVLDVAEQLGYYSNATARSLRSGRVRALAVVASSQDVSGFTSSVLLHAARAARAQNYGLLLLPDAEWRPRVERVFNSGQIDGVILHSSLAPTDTDMAGYLNRAVILQDGPTELPRLGLRVTIDASSALRRLVDNLLDLGHSRVAYFSPETHTGTRLNAYCEALRTHGIRVQPHYIVAADPLANEMPLAARRLLQQHPRPTAVVCGTDVLALGVYQAAAQLGLRIPEDLSVAGVGLHGIWDVLRPRLTALVSPAAEVASAAVDLLIRAIDAPDAELSSVVLQPSIAVGGSTAPPI